MATTTVPEAALKTGTERDGPKCAGVSRKVWMSILIEVPSSLGSLRAEASTPSSIGSVSVHSAAALSASACGLRISPLVAADTFPVAIWPSGPRAAELRVPCSILLRFQTLRPASKAASVETKPLLASPPASFCRQG